MTRRHYVSAQLRSKPVLKDFLQIELQWAGYRRPSIGRNNRVVDMTRGLRRTKRKMLSN
jgi:hypothetical protein